VVKAVALIGAVVVFLSVDCRLKVSESVKNELDASMQAQLGEYEVRIRKLEADRSEHDLLRAEAEAVMAQAESARAAKPLLRMMPVVELKPAYKDVSEIECTVEFTNVGMAEAPIRTVNVDVFHALATEETRQTIERTQRIFDCLELIDMQPVTEEEVRRRQEATLQFAELRLECPHGQLFSVSDQSKDVHWTLVGKLSETKRPLITLRPNQSVSEQFNYVLTQSLQLHQSWYRLSITATLEDNSSQRFAFIVPTRQPKVVTYRGTTSYAGDGSVAQTEVYRWSPPAPLAPIKE
jgi:hypothetical protein